MSLSSMEIEIVKRLQAGATYEQLLRERARLHRFDYPASHEELRYIENKAKKSRAWLKIYSTNKAKQKGLKSGAL